MLAGLPRFPLAPSLRGYRAAWLRNDFPAGLAIAAVGLPSAIAYPAIAGLPPETGLYASIAPLVAYAVFGPSRQLIVGPDAATMTVLAGALTAVLAATPGEADRVGVAAVLALVVGALYLLARLMRLGVLATFLSRPILTGFFAGVSLSILIGQIGRMTGVRIEAEGLVAPLARARAEGGIDPPADLAARRGHVRPAAGGASDALPGAGLRRGGRGLGAAVGACSTSRATASPWSATSPPACRH